MALDVRGAAAPAGLHDVGIQRALHEELDLRPAVSHDVSHRTLERADELASDDLAFAFRIGDPRQRLEEPVLDVDDHQPGTGGGDEIALHLGLFALAQQAWSTNTHVNRSPIARCTSAAA